MFDPAALGTLLIGLDAIRAERDDAPGRPNRRPARRTARSAGIRLVTARQLRRVADAVERPARQGAGV